LKLPTLGHHRAGRFDRGLSPDPSLGAAKHALQEADRYREGAWALLRQHAAHEHRQALVGGLDDFSLEKRSFVIQHRGDEREIACFFPRWRAIK